MVVWKKIKTFLWNQLNIVLKKTTNKDIKSGDTSYLCFNPVKKYLTLYTKKFNTKEIEAPPKARTRGL
ncbi:MAG: hypothetical protein Q8899_01895 [Weeping tea tree witches'-broom phytoplasma]|uniref:hypothetical protein n=1 Tax=Candidatus Phytoplasma melaleucae TaxID=2982630 RepID=UPI00293B5D0E|nr:hypothetical protein [Weeping tea tree witches'-broom phytoplasma]